MTLPEKIYKLRKQSGLTQEQLAERLNVSRQAVSKWELGTAIPESDKLKAIAECFGVSLDYLFGNGDAEKQSFTDRHTESRPRQNRLSPAGIIACALGGLGLIVWGLICILNPSAQEQIGASSVIRIDGNGILLIACIAALVLGAVLVLRGLRKG